MWNQESRRLRFVKIKNRALYPVKKKISNIQGSFVHSQENNTCSFYMSQNKAIKNQNT